MMKRLLLFALVSFMGIIAAQAVPARRGVKKTLTLNDGTRVEATLTGDEHVHYYLTADGRAIQLKGDEYMVVDRDSLKQLHLKRLTERNKIRTNRIRKAEYKGQKKGLVILVEFSDVKFTYDRAAFVDYFNKVGYNQNGMHGSVHDYFYEQSYGQFDLEFDVVGPVELTYSARYYGYDQSTQTSNNTRVAKMVNDVCKRVDDQVDFTKYDWDGDGTVDQVYVIYAGYGAAQGADHTIWPHEWTVAAGGTPYTTADGPKIYTYGISCELMGNGVSNTGQLDGIGTSCHEFSHCLGFPDFYDTREDGTNFGMGTWDLMDYGCYNGDTNGHCPSGYTAYERWVAGWLEPEELYSSKQVTDMPAIEDKPVAYIMYNDAQKNEYYLLANHQQKGFDTAQFGHGMLVLHVDYNAAAWTNNTVNNTASHQRMTIIPADNTQSNTSASLAADPFPGTRKKTELTNTSTPKASLYNENTDGTKLMNKPITDIDETNGLITFNFMGGVEIDAPVVKEPTNVTDNSFTANWEPYPGAINYTVALTKTVSGDDPRDFMIFGEDFSGFNYDVASSTDVSSSLDEYTRLPGWTGENVFRSPNKVRVGNASKTGSIVSPVFEQPKLNALSVAVTPISAGRTEGEMELHIILAETGQSASGTITGIPVSTSDDAGMTWLMGMEDWQYGPFQIGLYPKGSGVYLDWLSAYDGYYTWDDFKAPIAPKTTAGNVKRFTFSADDLEWEGGVAPKQVAPSRPRKASVETTTYYETKETSYTFTNLEKAEYSYRVRVTTAEGNSPWSDEASSVAVAVESVKADTPLPVTGRTYMLDGRQVENTKTLRPGVYVRDGKKFLVR